MQRTAHRMAQDGRTVAFVPTMGFLHDGHLALMREGREKGDVLIVSIFVNPTQFGPSEDLDQYPRDLKRDADLADSAGVDIVFTPDAVDMYGKHYQTTVSLKTLPNYLCGLSRPGHFDGVATVVSKLFNIVHPTVAVFGEKDYQQLAIIRQMTKDLNYPVQIHSVPTVRESDGLAMSSRNVYLSDKERSSALSLYQSLKKSQDWVNHGERDTSVIASRATELILSHPFTQKDYVSLCNPATLEPVAQVRQPTLMALAVRVGRTRLIDNTILYPRAP